MSCENRRVDAVEVRREAQASINVLDKRRGVLMQKLTVAYLLEDVMSPSFTIDTNTPNAGSGVLSTPYARLLLTADDARQLRETAREILLKRLATLETQP